MGHWFDATLPIYSSFPLLLVRYIAVFRSSASEPIT